MKMSHILQKSANLYPEAKFLSVADGRLISYKDSSQLADCYSSWIQNLVLARCVEIYQSFQVEVVVGFLSNNSPELFLATVGSVANQKSCDAIGNKQSRKQQPKNMMTAMLNVRWAPGEIAKALAVDEDSNGCSGRSRSDCCTRRHHMTIILYGCGMEESAKTACNLIHNDEVQQKYGHQCFCEAIPHIDCIRSVSETASKRSSNSETLFPMKDSCSVQDDALLLFTSGTTSGKPKGVRLSHASLILQSMAKLVSPCCYDSSTRILATTVPFFHVGGISSALAVAMSGGMLIFPQSSATSGFSPSVVLDSIHGYRKGLDVSINTNTLVVVPAMLHAILGEIEKSGGTNKYENVRLILVGGQSMTKPQLERSKRYFPKARIVQTFACTEAGSSITFSTIVDPTAHKDRPSCCDGRREQIHAGSNAGFPPHHIDLQIFRLDEKNIATDQVAKPYEIGAIGTRGLHVMNGYWKRGKEEYRDVKDWLILGDLGYLDDKGCLFFCGRSNDVIRTGGETVFSPEVERILIQHPFVDQCAVFALPDEKFGECVSVAIVDARRKALIQEGSNGIYLASEKVLREFREFCADRQLAVYKRPRLVFYCDELPCNSSGKVLKHVLANKCENVRNSIQSRL